MKKFVFILLFLIVLLGGLLRFYNIQQNPPGLYIDEVSIGVNAYDILTTGKDEHHLSYPMVFSAFGEYKMPIYIYLVAESMALFGKNEFAIRFPSAILGTLTIIVFFFLSKEFFQKVITKKYIDWFSLFAAFTLAISPWHIQFSRAGFEANVALFFYSLTMLFFLYCLRKRHIIFLIVSGLSLIIAFYTYDGYRLLIPLTVLGELIILVKAHFSKKWTIGMTLGIGILCLPLILFTLFQGGLMRFQETSAFTVKFANPLVQLLGNISIFLQNYFSYFSLTFLFRFGDQINRHQIQGWGLMYMWQLPLVLLGMYALLKNKTGLVKNILFFLLFVMSLTPALTQPSPHTLRFLYGLIPYTLLTTWGLYFLLVSKMHLKKIILCILGIFIFIEGIYYVDYYFVHYPKDALLDWGGGCKDVALRMKKEQVRFQQIIIDTHIPCISEYFLFYSPHVRYAYTTHPSLVKQSEGKTLVITANNNHTNGKPLYTIYLPNLNHDVFAQFWQL